MGSPSASLSSGASREGASGTVISGSGGAGFFAQSGSGVPTGRSRCVRLGGLGLGGLRAGDAPHDASRPRPSPPARRSAEPSRMRLYQQSARRRVAALEARHVQPVAARASAPRRAAGCAPPPRAPAIAAFACCMAARSPVPLTGHTNGAGASDGPARRRARAGCPAAARSRRAGVGQEHDRRLQALGAVHGHDAHLVEALLHVALDDRGCPRAASSGSPAGTARRSSS